MNRWGWLALALLLASCANNSSGDNDGGGLTARFDYTLLSSAGNLPVGRRVIFLYADWSGGDVYDIIAGDPRLSAYVHEFDGTVTEQGQIQIEFAHSRTKPYWASIYLDVDGSGTVTAGDFIWRDDDGNGPCGNPSPGISESYTSTTSIVFETAPDEYFFCWDAGAYAGPARVY